MLKKSPDLKQPAWNTIVWRYMGLDKFICLVLKKKLTLCRLDLLSDRHESSLPYEELLRFEKKKELPRNDYSIDDTAKKLEGIWKTSYASSWSMNPEESFALWKVYLNGTNPGVAIKTNFKDLVESISQDGNEVHVGKVRYYDSFERRLISLTDRFSEHRAMCGKMKPYEYESELRIFCRDNGDRPIFRGHRMDLGPPSAINLSVDLNRLVHEIYLSPWSRDWFRPSFRKLIHEINPELASRVKNSKIEDG